MADHVEPELGAFGQKRCVLGFGFLHAALAEEAQSGAPGRQDRLERMELRDGQELDILDPSPGAGAGGRHPFADRLDVPPDEIVSLHPRLRRIP